MNKLILNKSDASADQTTPLQYKNCIVPVCENRKSSLVHKVSKIKIKIKTINLKVINFSFLVIQSDSMNG